MSSGNAANIGSAVISAVFLIGSIIAAIIVNRVGRRPLMIWGFLVMTISMFILGFAPSAPVWIIMACFCAYAVFTSWPAILEWVYPNELFPTEVRATAVGVTTAFSRIGSVIGTFALPISLTKLGIGPTMLICAVLSLAGLVLSAAWALFHMVGASAIWSPNGQKLCESAYLATAEEDIDAPMMIYAEIDPALYDNQAKRRMVERRPELYKDLMLYTAPWDLSISTQSRQITSAALQYMPVIGNKDKNLNKIIDNVSEVADTSMKQGKKLDLVVLPELCLTGPVDTLDAARILQLADARDSAYLQALQNVARQFGVYVVAGFIERDNESLYNSVALLSKEGRIMGVYRNTRLTRRTTPGQMPAMKFWFMKRIAAELAS